MKYPVSQNPVPDSSTSQPIIQPLQQELLIPPPLPPPPPLPNLSQPSEVYLGTSDKYSNPASAIKVEGNLFPLSTYIPFPTSAPKVPLSHLIQQNAYTTDQGGFEVNTAVNMITDPYMLLFLQFYCRHIAIFMDYMVPVPIFQDIVPAIGLTEPVLMKAIAACGALMVSNAYPEEFSKDTAMEYYRESNKLLVDALEQKPRNLELCSISALLLTVFELLNNITYDLRAHLMSLHALLGQFTLKWNEKSQKVDFPSVIAEACFITMIQADVFTARLLGLLPLWSPQLWGTVLGVGNSNKPADSAFQSYLKIVYLVSKALHINSLGVDPTQPVNNVMGGRQSLLQELKEWESSLPPSFKPLFNNNGVEGKPFPDIFFASPVCSLAYTCYHSAIITLCDFQTGREVTPFRAEVPSNVDIPHHARSMCGIILSSDNMAVGVVTLWCFMTCSKFIYGLEERRALIAHLEKVRLTGWSNDTLVHTIIMSWGGPDWEQNMINTNGSG